MRVSVALVFVCVILLTSSASAVDWRDYTQFRHVSGLPGCAAPVTEDSQLEFGGALHMNIPCAYTPSKNNYSVLYATASRDSSIRFAFGGHRTDGSLHIMGGLGNPGHGLAVTGFFVDDTLRNTINVQYQVAEETVDRPALAVGILDIFDQRQKRQGFDGGAQSFYLTATRRLTESDRALYGTVGVGDGRFQGIFGGLSWYPTEKINLGAEYDGRIPRIHAAYELYSDGNFEGMWWGGWSNFDRPVIGFTVQYHP